MCSPSFVRRPLIDKEKRTLAAILMIIFICLCCLYLFFNGKEANSTSLNAYEKIPAKKTLNYLIVGDSIGRGAGVENRALTWFSQWEALLKKTYGTDCYRYSIVQSGATAFEGLYLFKQANQPDNIDLVFLVFGENDRKYMAATQFSFFYEALLREIKRTYPNAEIITVTESCLNDELFAQTIENLSNHYQTNHVDMRVPFQKSGKSAAELTADLVHPNGLGYRIYADTFLAAVKKGIQTHKELAYLKESITPSTDVKLKEVLHYYKKKGQFLKLNGFYSSRVKGSSISYQFTGSLLGVKVLKGLEGGEFDVFIDGQFVRRISTWWPIQRERMLYVTSDLPQGKHEVTFTMTGTKSANNTHDKPTIQISSIIIPEDS